MAQSGYTPIQLYYSTTASTAPTAGNLVAGELAINTNDGKLFYKDSSGNVQVIAGKGGAGVAGGSDTQVQYNSSGSLAGSANMTFDGNNLTVSGSTAGPKVNISSAALGTAMQLSDNTNYGVQFIGISGGMKLQMNGSQVFAINQVTFGEVLRINSSGNVGIGFNGASYTGKLAANGVIATYASTDNNYRGSMDVESGNLRFIAPPYASNPTNIVFNTGTASTERMRISSAGIVAINNTSPKTWYASAGVAQFGLAGALYGNTGVNQIKVLNNLYYDASGNSLYTNNGYSQDLTLDGNGNFIFYNSASGTAGGTVTELERMRIDANGNVGIGTSSPGYKLDVYGNLRCSGPTNGSVIVDGAAAGNPYVGFAQSNALGSYIQMVGTAGSNELLTNVNGAERMRINSSGAIGIGTSASTSGLEIATEGGQAYGQYLYVNSPNSSYGGGGLFGVNCARGAGSSFGLAQFRAANSVVCQILGNGNLINTNGSYGAISDKKFKENVVDATPKLDDVLKLQVRNFNFKDEQTHKQIGFIAQELEQVFPALVDTIVDKDDEGNELETTTKSVKTSVLIPVLVKAIQELNAKVTALEAQLAAK